MIARGSIVAWQENGAVLFGITQGNNRQGHPYVRPFADLGKLYTVASTVVVLFSRNDLLAGLQTKLSQLQAAAQTS